MAENSQRNKADHLKQYRWKKGDPSPNPGGRPKKTPLTDALRRLVETKESLKIKLSDDNAPKAAKHLLRLIASGKVSAFKEAADRIEGTVKQKVVYLGGEQEEGDRPVVVRVKYAPETPET